MILLASASPSPGPVKMTPRMTTLHEEGHFREDFGCRLQEEEEAIDEEQANLEEEVDNRIAFNPTKRR